MYESGDRTIHMLRFCRNYFLKFEDEIEFRDIVLVREKCVALHL